MSFQPRLLPLAATSTAIPAIQSISLVMPCYNEEKRLDAAKIVTFLQSNAHIHLILVNDGSTDLTLDLLLEMQDLAPRQITVVDLAQNSGKAEAVRHGLLHAVQSGADLTGYWDADLATPLEAIADFARIAARFGDVDVIFGSRRQMLGHRIERSFKRRAVSRLCAQMARVALSMPIGDTQCGAKILRNTAALRGAVAQPFTAGWLFDVELFSRIASATAAPRHAFYELPLSEWDEIAGSKVSGRAILRAGVRMLALIAQNRLGLVIGTAKATATKARVLVAPTFKLAA